MSVLKGFCQDIENDVRIILFLKLEATKIKLVEVNKFIVEIGKNKKINNENLVDLLQYCSLLEELKSTHEPVQI